MKTDPAPQPEQQHEDLTLLDPSSMKPNSTLHSARKRLRKMRRLFNSAENPRGSTERGGAQPRKAEPPPAALSAEGAMAEPSPGVIQPVPNSPLLIEKMKPSAMAQSPPAAAREPKPESQSTVLLLSDEGKIVDAHPSCSALLGWQSSELVGKGMGEVFDKGVDLLVECFLESPDGEGAEEQAAKEPIQVMAVRKDASTFPAEITLRRRAALNAWSVVLRSGTPAAAEDEPRVALECPVVPAKAEKQVLVHADSSTAASGNVDPAEASRSAEPEPARPGDPAPPDPGVAGNQAEVDLMRAQLECACNELQKSLEGIPQANKVVETASPAFAPVKPAEQETAGTVEAQSESAAPPKLLSSEPSPHVPAPTPAAVPENCAPALESESEPQTSAPQSPVLPATPVPMSPVPMPAPLLNDTEPVLEPETKPQERAPEAALPAEPAPPASAPVRSPFLAHEAFAVEPQLAHEVELAELERRWHESVGSLARVTAEFERERGARRRSEQRANDLAAQLQTLHQEFGLHLEAQKLDQQRLNELREAHRKLEESLNEARDGLAKETAERELAEEQLRAADDLSGRLEANLQAVEEAKKSFKDAEAEMEVRLAASARAVAESEARLKKETSERQRLEEALAQAQHELQEQAVRSRLDFSKRESTRHAYDLERRGCDADGLRSRYAAMENRRESHALLHGLCRQMHPPLAALHRSACQLLQGQLQEKDKQEIRALLENILLLQMSLQQASGTTRSAAVSDRAPEPESKPL